MTDEELEDYALTLILSQLDDFEYLSIFEMAESYLDGEEISDEDARKVDRLINTAKVTVSWGDD